VPERTLMRKLWTLYAVIAAFLVVQAAPLHAQTPAIPAMVSDLVLNPGDAVKITVWQKPELSGEFTVSADGRVADPFYMDVMVAGIPFATAAERVRTHLAQYEVNPRVLVEPLFRVAVTGEVRQPNVYGLRPETTVAQAVMLAGGPAERGHSNKVTLHRNQQTIRIDLSAPQSDRALMQVRSGDIIIVPRRTAVIRDVVGPISSVTTAVVSIAYLLTRYF
jgi:protein involved in polysaccharide export with SLBB domain